MADADPSNSRDLLSRVQLEQLRAGLGLVDEPHAIPLDPGHRFEVQKVIGSGGMGVVYLGHDTKLARPVALKVVRGNANELDMLEARLYREAQTLSTLSDRNVLVIYDVGRAVSGELFIAMQYVAGPTLRKWQQGRPWPEVLPVYIEAGRGLVAAHERQIVHRDFKPDNVLIEDRSPPRVLVGDFGLAVSPDEVGDALSGTPEYMAPEQRDRRPATPRSDQFAFCVALWEAWTGERPNIVDRSAPARPEAMPRWLYRLLVIGLSPRPEDRHEDLATLLDRLARNQRRQREYRVLAVVSALLSFGVAGGYSYGHQPQVPSLDGQPPSCQRAEADEVWSPAIEAQLRRELVRHQQPYAALMTGTLARQLAQNASARFQLAHSTCEQRRSTPANELLDRRERCLERWRRRTELQIERLLTLRPAELERAHELLIPLVELKTECSSPGGGERFDAEVFEALAAAQNAALLLDERRAEELGLAAVELATQRGSRCTAASHGSRELGRAQQQLGHNRRLFGRPDLAVPPLLVALEIAGACDDDVLQVDVQLDLAQLMTIDYEHPEGARPLLSSARGVLARRDGPPGIARHAELFEAEGFVELVSGNPEAAISAYQRALAILADADAFALERAKLHINIGSAQQENQRSAAATATYEQARVLLVDYLGPDHPATLSLLRSMTLNDALLMLEADEVERAAALLDTLVTAPEPDIRAKASSSWLITQLTVIDSTPLQARARARALELIELVTESPGLEPRTRAEALSMAGLVLVRMGDAVGFAHMRAALDIWRDRFPAHENTRNAAVSLCNELVLAGRHDAARAVLEIARSLTGPISEDARVRYLELERELAGSAE